MTQKSIPRLILRKSYRKHCSTQLLNQALISVYRETQSGYLESIHIAEIILKELPQNQMFSEALLNNSEEIATNPNVLRAFPN